VDLPEPDSPSEAEALAGSSKRDGTAAFTAPSGVW
jgi:hypothetical protein